MKVHSGRKDRNNKIFRTKKLAICFRDTSTRSTYVHTKNIIYRLPFSTLLSAKDVLASERLLKYLVNFITNGDPNQGYSIESAPIWEPATKGFSTDTR